MQVPDNMKTAGLTGLAALGGAAIAALLGVPAGALIGAMLAVALMAGLGHAVTHDGAQVAPAIEGATSRALGQPHRRVDRAPRRKGASRG